MKRNEDCIRSIMLYLEENLSAKKTLKGKELYAPLENFSKEDIDESIIIILERKLVSKKNIDNVVPSNIHFLRITDKGHNYLEMVRSDTVWNSLKEKFKGFLMPENIIKVFELFLSSKGLL